MLAAIGDVHGCSQELIALLEKILDHFNGRPGKIIMLGDYVDRGYDSRGVIDTLRAWDHPNVEMIYLKGNHDEMMIRCTLTSDLSLLSTWLDKGTGGQATIDQLGDDLPEYARWLRANLQPFYRTDKHYFVHAGIMPGIPLDEQDEKHTLWIRNPFLNYSGPRPEGLRVVHGHTPTPDPVMLDNRLGLDTGCVYGGYLTAAIFNDNEDHIGFQRVKLR